jgi:hypothetical protein
MINEPRALMLARNLESNGKGCSCHARYSSDCCCPDAIWADDFVFEAAKELRRLHHILIERTHYDMFM